MKYVCMYQTLDMIDNLFFKEGWEEGDVYL